MSIAIISFTDLLSDTIELFLAFLVLCQHNSHHPTLLDVENFELLVNKPLEKAWLRPLS